MRRYTYVAVLGLSACSGGVGAGDAGLELPDTAMASDTAPSPEDVGTDTRMTGCNVTGTYGALPADCLPRCTSATWDMVVSGTCTGNCLVTALRDDPTPTIPWSVNGVPQPMPLTCAECWATQATHCLSVAGCTTQLEAYDACRAGAGHPACTAELDAVDACETANMSAFSACANDANMGLIPCFAI